jgi:hypothetical protein
VRPQWLRTSAGEVYARCESPVSGAVQGSVFLNGPDRERAIRRAVVLCGAGQEEAGEEEDAAGEAEESDSSAVSLNSESESGDEPPLTSLPRTPLPNTAHQVDEVGTCLNAQGSGKS